MAISPESIRDNDAQRAGHRLVIQPFVRRCNVWKQRDFIRQINMHAYGAQKTEAIQSTMQSTQSTNEPA